MLVLCVCVLVTMSKRTLSLHLPGYILLTMDYPSVIFSQAHCNFRNLMFLLIFTGLTDPPNYPQFSPSTSDRLPFTSEDGHLHQIHHLGRETEKANS